MAAANADFDERLTTTLNNHRGTIVDNVFAARPLAHYIKEAGNVKITGGDRIVRPVRFKKNTSVMPYEGADTLSTTTGEGSTSAAYDWKQVSASVVIDGITKARNGGEAKIIDILQDRIEVAEESLIDYFNTTWWGDGSVAKSMNGLGNLVLDPADGNVVGGIDPADEALWTPNVTTANTVLSDVNVLAPIFNSSSVGADQPNVIITTQDLFEKYESLLQPNMRYADEDAANAGFTSLRYKQVPVTYDESCPADTLVMLNTKYLQAVFHEDTFMKATPFVRPSNQDVMIAQILTYGNLIITNRKRQGAFTDLTVS